MADDSKFRHLLFDAVRVYCDPVTSECTLAHLYADAISAYEDQTLRPEALVEIAETLDLPGVPDEWFEAAGIVPSDVLECTLSSSRWPLVRAISAIERGVVVEFEYRNYRGEQATRHVQPRALRHGPTTYHKTPGWKLEAFDIDRSDVRTFDTVDIRDWREVKP